jgi:hypothetical protein
MPSEKVYLSDTENRLVRERAEAENVSLSYLVRCGVRIILGLPIPSRFYPSDDEPDSQPDR